MTPLVLIAADLAAITVLTFALYLRRHRRRDLVVSYLGMNVGVMAVAVALSGSAAGIGLGLGLFGVLSIIRLRSTELAQHEVAYYFSALALGLIAGLGIEPVWLPLALMALILLVMFVGDHPRVLPAYRHQTVVLDRAIAGDSELHARLEEVLHGTVHSATVQELDLVNDKTIVDVRYAYRPAGAPHGVCPPPAAIPTGTCPGRSWRRPRQVRHEPPAISAGLRHLPAVGLEELNTAAALQTRVDRKYVIPVLQARQLLLAASLDAGVRVLEMDGLRTFDYDSVYFDTAAAGQLPAGGQGPAAALQDPHPDLRRQRRKLPGGENGRRPRGHGQGTHPVLPGRPEPDHRRRPRLRQRHTRRRRRIGPGRTAGTGARNPLPAHHTVPARIRQPGHPRRGRHLAAPGAGPPGSWPGPWCSRPSRVPRPDRWTGISGPTASGPAASPSSPPAWPPCARSCRPTAGTARSDGASSCTPAPTCLTHLHCRSRHDPPPLPRASAE